MPRFYNEENVTSLGLDLLEIGSAHDALADLADKDKCLYYEMAQQELDHQSSLIQGDFWRTAGNFPWRRFVSISTGYSTR
jgi:hypothetical protein